MKMVEEEKIFYFMYKLIFNNMNIIFVGIEDFFL